MYSICSIGSLVQSTLPTSEFSSFVGFDFFSESSVIVRHGRRLEIVFFLPYLYIIQQYINPICLPPNSHYEAQMEYYLFDLP